MNDMAFTPLDERRVSHAWTRDKVAGDGIFRSDGPQGEVAWKRHKLDEPKCAALFEDLKGHWTREIERQASWRMEMESDEDIYDSIQWTTEEQGILEDRGQVPLVFNVTASAINWILGNQRRQPMDYKILPRQNHGQKQAEIKSQLLKYLSDVNDGPMQINMAFEECVKAGLGWIETGVQDDEEGEPIFMRYESWRNIIYDSMARKPDLSDARYMFRAKWTDSDWAEAMFPERIGIIRSSAHGLLYGNRSTDHGMGAFGMGDSAMDSAEEDYSGNYSLGGLGAPRGRVRLYECWFKKPSDTVAMKGGQFSGEIWDKWSEGHQAEVGLGKAELSRKVRSRMYVAIFCDAGLLYLGPSPYRHNRYPFTPIFCNRRARDGAPYGIIRVVKDIQRDLNKRASKALWHLSAKRAMIQEGAVDDEDDFREEMSRPDAILKYKRGFAAPAIETDLQHAAAQSDAMTRNILMIEQTSGVTGENQGRASSGEQSGKAIGLRQDQGELVTNKPFENLRYARKKIGDNKLSLIEQFMNKERQFRITDQRGNPQYVTINTPEGDGQDNRIGYTKADFVVEEVDFRATHRQQNLASLFELLGMVGSANPQFIMGVMDLLVESMDIPKQAEIVKRIREVTGMKDPDADPNNPTPEDQAIDDAKKAQAEMQARQMEAEIAKLEGEGEEKKAKALKTLAEMKALAMEGNSKALDGFKVAIESAIQIAGLPQVAAVADQILAQAKAMAEGQDPGMPPPGPALPPDPAMMPAQPAPAF